jgi:hypothetical protein
MTGCGTVLFCVNVWGLGPVTGVGIVSDSMQSAWKVGKSLHAKASRAQMRQCWRASWSLQRLQQQHSLLSCAGELQAVAMVLTGDVLLLFARSEDGH